MANGLAVKDRLVTVFGGSGFVGRHVVRELANRGWRVRVACRRPDLAFFLQPLGRVGQVVAVQANVRVRRFGRRRAPGRGRRRQSRRRAGGGRTPELRGGARFRGAAAIGKAATAAGISNVVHVSAIGASAESDAAYARTKARGEAAIREAAPDTIVFRPSIVFGPEDGFFNRFAAMARIMPVLPLIGADTKFQPVFVGDVATAIADALDGKAKAGATYELGGPEVATFRDLVAYICDLTGRKRLLAPLPFGAGRLMAFATEIASKASLGLFPAMLTTTRDQVEMLRTDNVVSEAARAEGRTLEGAGHRSRNPSAPSRRPICGAIARPASTIRASSPDRLDQPCARSEGGGTRVRQRRHRLRRQDLVHARHEGDAEQRRQQVDDRHGDEGRDEQACKKQRHRVTAAEFAHFFQSERNRSAASSKYSRPNR